MILVLDAICKTKVTVYHTGRFHNKCKFFSLYLDLIASDVAFWIAPYSSAVHRIGHPNRSYDFGVEGNLSSGRSKGGASLAPPPLAQNFFIFMQFSGKIDQIIGWRPLPLGLVPPPLGNPGSATAKWKSGVRTLMQYMHLTS